jgi:hypothetical protein
MREGCSYAGYGETGADRLLHPDRVACSGFYELRTMHWVVTALSCHPSISRTPTCWPWRGTVSPCPPLLLPLCLPHHVEGSKFETIRRSLKIGTHCGDASRLRLARLCAGPLVLSSCRIISSSGLCEA